MTKNCMNGLKKERPYEVSDLVKKINKEIVKNYTKLFTLKKYS